MATINITVTGNTALWLPIPQTAMYELLVQAKSGNITDLPGFPQQINISRFDLGTIDLKTIPAGSTELRLFVRAVDIGGVELARGDADISHLIRPAPTPPPPTGRGAQQQPAQVPVQQPVQTNTHTLLVWPLAITIMVIALVIPLTIFAMNRGKPQGPSQSEIAANTRAAILEGKLTELNSKLDDITRINRAPQPVLVTNSPPTVANAANTNASTSAFGPGAAQSGNGIQLQIGNGSTVVGGIRWYGDNHAKRHGWPYNCQPKATAQIVKDPTCLTSETNRFTITLEAEADFAFSFPSEQWVVSYEGNFAEIDSAFDVGEFAECEWEWCKLVGPMTGDVRKVRFKNRGPATEITFVISRRQ